MNPLVSICIPTYEMKGKGVEYLFHSFNILHNQSYKNFEVIISDNSKNDEIDISKLNLKSINISSLEEFKNPNIVDYKKLPLNKLRSIVVEKELVADSSKLKKNEILKLLGAE